MKKITLYIIISGLLFGVSCKQEGCTDSIASNYDEDADVDNGSCQYSADLVFWSDSARTRSLTDNNINTPINIFVNGENIGKLNYYNYLSSEPNCTDSYADKVYEEVLNYTYFMGDDKNTIEIKIEDSQGVSLNSQTITVTHNECSAVLI